MANEFFFKQLTYSDIDEKWGLYCTCTGSVHLDNDSSYSSVTKSLPRHYTMDRYLGRRINEFQIVYVTEGYGTYTSEGMTQPINSGTLLLLYPNRRHFYFPEDDSGWNEHWVGFRGQYPELLRTNGILDDHRPVLHIGYNEKLLASFDEIHEVSQRTSDSVQRKLCIEIQKLVAEIMDFRTCTRTDDLQEHIMERAELFLRENLYSTLDIESMTNQLSISYKALIELFRDHTAMTPYQYFLHMKINKAKDLLAAGELSVKEISYKLEFQNPYYFSRLFKKKTGIPPSQWGSVTTRVDDVEITDTSDRTHNP